MNPHHTTHITWVFEIWGVWDFEIVRVQDLCRCQVIDGCQVIELTELPMELHICNCCISVNAVYTESSCQYSRVFALQTKSGGRIDTVFTKKTHNLFNTQFISKHSTGVQTNTAGVRSNTWVSDLTPG